MTLRVLLCLMLAGCSTQPVVPWPAGPAPVAPDLLPAAELALAPAGTAEARGAALATEAAALKLRAAAIGTD